MPFIINKELIIDCCDDCKFFDNEYYDYYEICTKLKREIKKEFGAYKRYIPNDCPLPVSDKPIS